MHGKSRSPFRTGGKPKISISPSSRFTMSTESGEGGGYIGLHKPTKFGEIGIGIGGGGAYSKEHGYSGFTVTPTISASFTIGGKKKKKKKNR